MMRNFKTFLAALSVSLILAPFAAMAGDQDKELTIKEAQNELVQTNIELKAYHGEFEKLDETLAELLTVMRDNSPAGVAQRQRLVSRRGEIAQDILFLEENKDLICDYIDYKSNPPDMGNWNDAPPQLSTLHSVPGQGAQ